MSLEDAARYGHHKVGSPSYLVVTSPPVLYTHTHTHLRPPARRHADVDVATHSTCKSKKRTTNTQIANIRARVHWNFKQEETET